LYGDRGRDFGFARSLNCDWRGEIALSCCRTGRGTGFVARGAADFGFDGSSLGLGSNYRGVFCYDSEDTSCAGSSLKMESLCTKGYTSTLKTKGFISENIASC
jgi:hypothetical protein